tara:strand:- start:81 stop:794 length:714 start_codon:yes stop_codon:yes gene_type:complete
MMEIISRKEAIEKGLKTYFTGKPCNHSHIAPRRVSNYKCTQCLKNKHDKWLDNNQEKVKEWRKNYANNNREKLNKYQQRYRDKYPEKAKLRGRKHTEIKRKRYPKRDAVLGRMRASIHGLIKRGKTKQGLINSKKIGCNSHEFMAHIESQFTKGMNWENRDSWHIDHIRPCNSFDLFNESEIEVCFNWRNLRPLCGKENLQKQDTYTPLDEVAWVERMLSLGYEGELFLKYEEGNSY